MTPFPPSSSTVVSIGTHGVKYPPSGPTSLSLIAQTFIDFSAHHQLRYKPDPTHHFGLWLKMAPIRTSMRSNIVEPSTIGLGIDSTSATTIHRTLATCISEPGRTRSTQARKKAVSVQVPHLDRPRLDSDQRPWKCEYCYRVHKRCTGTFPCDRCVKAGCAEECTEHKRQRHNGLQRRDAVPSPVTVISSLRSSTETKKNQSQSSVPVELVR